MEEKEGTLWGLETGLSGLPLGSHDKLRLCLMVDGLSGGAAGSIALETMGLPHT